MAWFVHFSHYAECCQAYLAEESGASPKQEVEDNNKEPSILFDFSACIYEYEDEATFEDAFYIMRSKTKKQT